MGPDPHLQEAARARAPWHCRTRSLFPPPAAFGAAPWWCSSVAVPIPACWGTAGSWSVHPHGPSPRETAGSSSEPRAPIRGLPKAGRRVTGNGYRGYWGCSRRLLISPSFREDLPVHAFGAVGAGCEGRSGVWKAVPAPRSWDAPGGPSANSSLVQLSAPCSGGSPKQICPTLNGITQELRGSCPGEGAQSFMQALL